MSVTVRRVTPLADGDAEERARERLRARRMWAARRAEADGE